MLEKMILFDSMKVGQQIAAFSMCLLSFGCGSAGGDRSIHAIARLVMQATTDHQIGDWAACTQWEGDFPQSYSDGQLAALKAQNDMSSTAMEWKYYRTSGCPDDAKRGKLGCKWAGNMIPKDGMASQWYTFDRAMWPVAEGACTSSDARIVATTIPPI